MMTQRLVRNFSNVNNLLNEYKGDEKKSLMCVCVGNNE
jgi:hypothetical protein